MADQRGDRYDLEQHVQTGEGGVGLNIANIDLVSCEPNTVAGEPARTNTDTASINVTRPTQPIKPAQFSLPAAVAIRISHLRFRRWTAAPSHARRVDGQVSLMASRPRRFPPLWT